MNNRQNKILEFLSKNQRVKVTELAGMLNVSPVTIRKDLDMLETRGLIQREHGFASVECKNRMENKLAYNYRLKQRIAKAAATTVKDSETVMIGPGSCCAILAEELVNTKNDVTIITNSISLANHIRYNPRARIILLGGYYQRNSHVLIGPLTHKSAELFSPNKFFISASGFSEKSGFTGQDYVSVQTLRELAKQAQQLVMLFDSEKFSNNGVVKLVMPENISALYTDDLIPPEKEAYLLEKNVAIHKVAAV